MMRNLHYFVIIGLLCMSVLSLLPGCSSIPEVSIESIEIAATDITPGTSVNIDTIISADETGGTADYSLTLAVNGANITTKTGTINSGDKKLVRFTYTPESDGLYSIIINGKTSSFEVVNPAHFSFSNLSISPESPETKEECTFSINITNDGDLPGTYTASLVIDDAEISAEDLMIDAGATVTAEAHYTSDTAKTLSVSFCGLTEELTVKKPASQSLLPTITIPTTRTYTSPLFYYEITYPKSYNVNTENTYGIYISHFVEGTTYLKTDQLFTTDTLDEYFDNLKTELNETGSWQPGELTPIIENETTVGYSFDITTREDGVNKQGIGMAIKKGSFGFYVGFTSETETWESVKETAAQILDSFELPAIYTGNYANNDLGISFVLPDNWSLIETGSGSTPVCLYSYPHEEFNVLGFPMTQTVSCELNIVNSQSYADIETYVLSEANGSEVYSFELNDSMIGYEYIRGMYANSTMIGQYHNIVIGINDKFYHFTFTGYPSLEGLFEDISTIILSIELLGD